MSKDIHLGLHLGRNQPGRRAGLARTAYLGPSQLTINATTTESPAVMAPKPNTSKAATSSRELPIREEEEDYNRPPDSDSSSDDENKRANLKSTVFGAASKKVEPPPKKPAASSSRTTRGTNVNGRRLNGKILKPRSSQSRSTSIGASSNNNDPFSDSDVELASPPPSKAKASSSNRRGSPKRKSQEDAPRLGAGMQDTLEYKGKASNKRIKSTYSSKGAKKSAFARQSSFTSKPKSSQEQVDDDDDGNATPKRFKMPSYDFDTPESAKSGPDAAHGFKIPDLPGLDSPMSTPGTPGYVPKWKTPANIISPEKNREDSEIRPVFKHVDMGDLGFEPEIPASDPDSSLGFIPQSSKNSAPDESPLTQLPGFKTFDFDLTQAFSSTVQDLVRETVNQLPSSSRLSLDDDDDSFHLPASSQRARCPMCNQPVDPEDLRKLGSANLRKQEQFCRSHKERKAKEDWETNKYPKINWKLLDSRVTKHHSFIKSLIKGAESHYRSLHSTTVKEGKDRNLLKMTSNTTPGYYGTRGLRAVSENIMHRFTPLLKKRMVEDKLMSARGVTPYIHSVIVPEVVVLLIMEDMRVDEERARQILAESASLGELLNEEVEDVVSRHVEDSASESDDGY